MKPHPIFVLTTLILSLIVFSSSGQETINSRYIDRKGRTIRYNIVKTNLVGWPFGMFNIAYERKLNKTFSALIELNVFGKPSFSNFTRSDSAQNSTNYNYNSSGFSLSPEFRWYLGRNGSPRGYYLGIYVPIINYNAKVDVSSQQYQAITDNSGTYSQPLIIEAKGSLSPNFTFYGLGLAGGPQFLIGNRISLEFYLNFAIGTYSITNKDFTQTGTASVLLPSTFANGPTGNFTAAELASFGLNVDPSTDYSYEINGNGSDRTLVAHFNKTENNQDIKDFNSGLTILPRIGFSLGYAFGK